MESATGKAGHTVKCHRCGRTLRAASSVKRLYGRGCWTLMRAAALAEAVKGFAATAIEKAQQLIADGGIIATGRKGIMRAVSSKGDETYLVTATGQCNCIAALKSGKADRCYHTAAARLLAATGKA